MKWSFGQDEAWCAWVSGRVGVPCVGIAFGLVDDEGNPVMGAVYSSPSETNIFIDIAAASPAWATRDHIRGFMAYPFLQLGLKRMTCLIAKGNKRCRKLAEGLGFRLEGVHHDILPSGTGISYGLSRKDAERWLERRGRIS